MHLEESLNSIARDALDCGYPHHRQLQTRIIIFSQWIEATSSSSLRVVLYVIPSAHLIEYKNYLSPHFTAISIIIERSYGHGGSYNNKKGVKRLKRVVVEVS